MHTEFFLIAMIAIAAVTDIASRRIPNALVAAGLAAAFVLQTFLPAAGGWQSWLLGALTGLGIFLPFYLARGMGAGDVKLMAAVGSFAGPLLAAKIALAAFLVGGIWALCVIVWKGKLLETAKNLFVIAMPLLARAGLMRAPAAGLPGKSVGRLPYGVAIALGTLAVLFLHPL